MLCLVSAVNKPFTLLFPFIQSRKKFPSRKISGLFIKMPAWEGKVVKMVIVSTLSAFQSTHVQFMREKKSDAAPQKRPHGIILVQYLSPPLLRCSISGKKLWKSNISGAMSVVQFQYSCPLAPTVVGGALLVAVVHLWAYWAGTTYDSRLLPRICDQRHASRW